MAIAVGMSPIGLFNYGLNINKKSSYGRFDSLVSKSPVRFHPIRAVQDNVGPRRLVDIIRTVPDISRNYFKRPSRRALFGGIALLGGFYVAQTISLSFGALGVNDVIAAVLCVLLTEYATKFYYSRSKLVDLGLNDKGTVSFLYILLVITSVIDTVQRSCNSANFDNMIDVGSSNSSIYPTTLLAFAMQTAEQSSGFV